MPNSASLYKPNDEFRRQANVSGLEDYQALWEFADKDYLQYWGDLARELFTWKKPFMQIFDDSNPPFYKWFADGTLNVSYNCLDRHLPDKSDKLALIFESDFGQVSQFTYAQLHNRVCRFGNALRELGIKKGRSSIQMLASQGTVFNGWMGMADWALFFPPILQGIISIPGFFFVIVALAMVYMFFASKQLRADEAAAKAAGKTLEQMDGYGVEESVETEQPQVASTANAQAIRILAVCGSGQGSSMMMKMKIKGYLDKRGIPNVMDSCAVTDYKGKLNEVDIIVSSKHLADEIEVGEGKSVLGVQNMLNPNSFGDELVELINKHQAEK